MRERGSRGWKTTRVRVPLHFLLSFLFCFVDTRAMQGDSTPLCPVCYERLGAHAGPVTLGCGASRRGRRCDGGGRGVSAGRARRGTNASANCLLPPILCRPGAAPPRPPTPSDPAAGCACPAWGGWRAEVGGGAGRGREALPRPDSEKRGARHPPDPVLSAYHQPSRPPAPPPAFPHPKATTPAPPACAPSWPPPPPPPRTAPCAGRPFLLCLRSTTSFASWSPWRPPARRRPGAGVGRPATHPPRPTGRTRRTGGRRWA